MVLAVPIIPETITVHLGAPTQNAPNVTVSFTDYIKNVASSEIFPTWDEEALKANIYAQISYTLNRIYTEWYPSQGYDFDITSITQFDQKFIPNREIFASISYVVDEIFNTYIRKIGTVEPFLAPYCDGFQTRCSGLEQWGTVDLAAKGLTAFEILEYYYGDDIELVNDAPIISNSQSYPGSPLKFGDFGKDVQIIQSQLNRISSNYPLIPKIATVQGEFDFETAAAVRVFQQVFTLAPTGIVDEATWYKISYIYAVVKNLAELESEGVEYSFLTQQFPQVLTVGDTSQTTNGGVSLLQYFLSVIGVFEDDMPEVEITDLFDQQTEAAVRTFQMQRGLPETGMVDKTTWDAIYDAFQGIAFVIPAVEGKYPIEPYKGVLLRQGSTGETVMLMQNYLNVIAEVYPRIPTVEAIGIFGPQTLQTVRAFQLQFGLPVDGIVGAATWQEILVVYEATLRRANPAVPQYNGILTNNNVE